MQLDSVRLLIAVGRFSLPVPDLSVDARAGLHVDLLAVRAQLHAQVRVAVPQRLVLRHRNAHVSTSPTRHTTRRKQLAAVRSTQQVTDEMSY